MKTLLNLFLYFVLAVVFFGGSGVWIPIIINEATGKGQNMESILQNLSTYGIAIIAAGCIDSILLTLNSSKIKNKIGLILLILIILFGSILLVGLDFYWILNNNIRKAEHALWIAIPIAYIFWWISNWSSKNINPIDALGGNI